ncbi:MAG: tRNA (cytidine32/uridine32-2'-O)-methyltransferase [Polaribacter sp.]|jgi:tRNA (cytidine32/uridine32-2'-O)-methyltransferase
MSLNNIKIALVRTFHPGNIGSAARSMKTMGLSDLCLVAPRNYPSLEANKMAAGAQDTLLTAGLADSVAAAVAECSLVIATTARIRGYDLPELNPEQAATMLVEHAKNAPVALIFGPERMGLHNDDIKYAKYRVSIPANPEYSSLNLASAVQILSYEIFKASSKPNLESQAAVKKELPTSDDIERLHVHLESVLREIQFLRPHQGETLQRLRHLIARAEPDVLELNILRGILNRIEQTLNPKA